MMTFPCPACDNALSAPVSAAGRNGRCPCGARFTIPGAAVAVANRRDADDDYLLETMLRRRREKKARRALLLNAGLCGALLVALLGIVIVVRARPKGAPKEQVERPETERAAPARAPAPVRPVADPPRTGPVARPAPRPSEVATGPGGSAPNDPQPAIVVPSGPFAPPATSDLSARPAKPLVPEREPEPAEEPAPRPADFKSDRPAKEVFSGYFQKTHQKFTLYVSRLAYEKSDEAGGGPLQVVRDEINRLTELFPEPSLKSLRQIPIWVEWDHTIPRDVRAFAVYYGDSGHGLAFDGVDPRKAGCVCVLSLKTAHKLRAQNAKQNTLLHEFAHVIHDKAFGFDAPLIRNAFGQATSRELYRNVRHDDGHLRDAYAGTRHTEYFAELTCAYLDRLDYFPHDVKELKEYDSVGYEMMTKAYGTPEQIAAARKGRPKK